MSSTAAGRTPIFSLMESQIERIKRNLSITDAWSFLELQGKPSRECRSPFRDDKRASFTIYRESGWERWFDHGEGCGGDVVDLWQRARGLSSVKDAIRDIVERIPALNVSEPILERFSRPEPDPAPPKAPSSVRWPPDLRPPTNDECVALGKLRGLEPGTFWLAGRLGTLKVATVYHAPAWILTDASGTGAQARRFDGAMYTVNGKKVKGFALPGSRKYWPVGLLTDNELVNAGRRLVLVEGEGDYFAALQLCAQADGVRPMAMLGASPRIGAETRGAIWGARVLIIPHNDPPGAKSEENWTSDLRELGAAKIVIQRLPFEVNDLNEFLSLNPQEPVALLKGLNGSSRTGGSQSL